MRRLSFAFCMSGYLVAAQAQDELLERELKIKIAYLFHFSQFTQWPTPSAFFNYCVYDDSELTEHLKKAYLGKTIAGGSISVQTIDEQSDIDPCQIIYFPHLVSNTLLTKVKTKPILTVGLQKNFLALDGIIYLFEENQKIHFAINHNQAQSVGLKMNAQLLSLSKEPPL